MKTILIVEDDPTQLSALSEKLSTQQLRVLSARNGKDGWNMLVKERPDLLLLDIMLPGGMNGFDLLEQAKKDPRVQHIPVIVLTNLDTEEKVSRTIGAADYIVKANTSLDDVVGHVNRVLGGPDA